MPYAAHTPALAQLHPPALSQRRTRWPTLVATGATAAMSMNYVDFTNADEAFRTLLEDTDLHPKYRSRLNKRGRVVPGSQTRWYERFQMPIEGKEQRRMQAVAQHVQQQPPRPDAAFLEPWQSFEKRPWNLHLVSG